MRDVRAIIDGICFPQWVYVKRTLPERAGHFYEEPDNDYPVIDHDKLNRKESCVTLMKILGIEKKIYSVFIGRWQPLHAGHLALFDKVRDEGKNIAIGIRDTTISERDPYTIAERRKMIEEKVPDAEIFVLPDTEEIVYGRKVGWGIREIRLDEKTEAISATKLRELCA
jgi:cytidyltransferase-like protein